MFIDRRELEKGSGLKMQVCGATQCGWREDCERGEGSSFSDQNKAKKQKEENRKRVIQKDFEETMRKTKGT